MVKEVFLHIACFFKGEKKNYVMDILEGCDLPKYGINVLIEKGLLRITEANDIWMHDLLEEMGKDIVCQESPEPGERSRLWLYEDVHHVFVNNTGTDKVKGIMVKEGIPRQRIPLNGESFLKLKYLQILIIWGDIFDGDHVYYLRIELRLLDWARCPLRYFPSNFHLRKLVVLKLTFIKSYKLSFWETIKSTCFLHTMPSICASPLGKGGQFLQNLKSMELVNCDGVINTSDFSMLHNLVDLVLESRENAVEVDLSNGFEKLANLQVGGILEKFEIVKEMKSLRRVNLSFTAIRELSSSTIGYLINLEQLILSNCRELKDVSCSIFELQHVQLLDLSGCQGLARFRKKSEFSTESTNVQKKHYAPLLVNLRGCRHLYHIKAGDVAKVKGKLPDRCCFTGLLSLFFSCRQAEYEVLFRGRDILSPSWDTMIPEWFTCRMDIFMRGITVYNCRVDFPGNFRWEDKGLSFSLNAIRGDSQNPDDDEWGSDDFVWLYYRPFDAIIKLLGQNGLPPPSVCLVKFEVQLLTRSQILVGENFKRKNVKGSCGVHVVTPDDEGPFVTQAWIPLQASDEEAESSCLINLERIFMTSSTGTHEY